MDALAWLRKQLDGDGDDLLAEMVREFAQRLMAAEVDALTGAGWEGGRIVNVAVVIATGVNNDGHREILGVDVITTEDGAGWLAFLRGLVGRRRRLGSAPRPAAAGR